MLEPMAFLHLGASSISRLPRDRFSHGRSRMPLTVYSCVSYVPNFDGTRTQEHWTALHFVKAIKGTPLAGYATLSTPVGETIRIDRTTAGAAPEWFGQLVTGAVPWRDLLPCAFVPIPDAACDIAAGRPLRTFVLAETLVSALGGDVAVCDALRWSRPMSPAHVADGSRDPQTLYGRLRLKDRRWPLAGQRLVLVDDVVARPQSALRAPARRSPAATIPCLRQFTSSRTSTRIQTGFCPKRWTASCSSVLRARLPTLSVAAG